VVTSNGFWLPYQVRDKLRQNNNVVGLDSRFRGNDKDKGKGNEIAAPPDYVGMTRNDPPTLKLRRASKNKKNEIQEVNKYGFNIGGGSQTI